MEDKCPKCGETLITRTIRKKLGLGSIDYPVAQICPKCNWNKDLTGAGDITAKPVLQDAGEARKEGKKVNAKSSVSPKPPSEPTYNPQKGINTLIPIVLGILVVGAIAWVFFPNPAEQEQADNTPKPIPTPIPTPIVTQIPVDTPKSTPTPEVTASGNKKNVFLESKRGFTPNATAIKAGDEIIWTNEGTYTVTLVSSESLFEDKPLNVAKRTNYTFKRPGTFRFYLKEDINLTGTIIVEP